MQADIDNSNNRVIMVSYWLNVHPQVTRHAGRSHLCASHAPDTAPPTQYPTAIASAVDALRKEGREVVCVGYGGRSNLKSTSEESSAIATAPSKATAATTVSTATTPSPTSPTPRDGPTQLQHRQQQQQQPSPIAPDGRGPSRDSSPPATPTTATASNVVNVSIPQATADIHFRFCKGVLWPMFHYIQGMTVYANIKNWWSGYLRVNEMFAEKIAKEVYKEGDLIIINDYHLMMLPQMLRAQLPNATIGFFLNIPWPSSEIYRALPMRNEVLHGILEADMVAFQTFSYLRHFTSCVTRLLGFANNDRGIETGTGHFVRVDAIPIGIDPQVILSTLAKPSVKERIAELQKRFEGIKLIVARSLIDPTNGLPRTIKSFDTFLKTHPDYVGKVVLFLHCIPNAEVMNEQPYQLLCEEIETLVGSANGRYGTLSYTPIIYTTKTQTWEEECALFAVSDVGLVLPIRSGMNLTSHEFVMCQKEKMGPLILSESTGAAQCLSGAILVNAWDEKRVVKTLYNALTLSDDNRKIRYKHNLDYVMSHNCLYWIKAFVRELNETKQRQMNEQSIQQVDVHEILGSFKKSKRRLLLLDYDGTLTPIVKKPSDAIPSPQMMKILEGFSKDSHTDVYIISGRDRHFLEQWFGNLRVGLSCEHGSFFRPCKKNGDAKTDNEWQELSKELDLSWQADVQRILEDFADRTPGSFVEQKEIDLTWHYRESDPVFAEQQKRELIDHLQTSNMPIDVLVGKKAVEVRPQGVNKAFAVRKILAAEEGRDNIDFVLCAGDDKTDEDMFEEVRKRNEQFRFQYCVVIGKKDKTHAEFFIDRQNHLEALLKKMAGLQS